MPVIQAPVRSLPTHLAVPVAVAGLALLVLALPTTPVAAQMTQYTAPGGEGGGGGLPSAQAIEQQMEAARWQLGPLRLAPYLALRGLTWEENLFVEDGGGESDLTGAVAAGVSAYMPTGSNVFWIAQAFPEYVFWLDRSDRNQVVGRYGTGVVADLNRLRLTADVRSTEQQTVVTSESPQQVIADQQVASAATELRLGGTIWLSAGAARADLAQRRPDEDEPLRGFDFSRLDRRETRFSYGLLWRPSEGVELGAGVHETDTEFEAGARNLSSTGTSPYVRLRLEGNRITLDAQVVQRRLAPEPGSELTSVDSTQGRAELRLTPGWRFRFSLYGHRSTVYALDSDYSHFDDERYGLRVGAPFGDRLRLSLFAEGGRDDYQALAGAPGRRDDVTAWGVDATWELGEWLSYRAGFHQLEYDSNLPGFDRDVTRIVSTVVLSTGAWVWE